MGRIKITVIASTVLVVLAGAWAWYWYLYGGRAASLAKSDDVRQRTRAAKTLADIHTGLSRRTLQKLSVDPETIVSVNAVRSLARDDSDEALNILLQLAREAPPSGAPDTRGSVRGEAAAALGSRKDMAIGELIEMLRSDPNQAARCGAAEGLGIRGDRAALPALIAALDDESLGVRVKSIEALKKTANLTTDYSPADPPNQRQAAIALIRQQLEP